MIDKKDRKIKGLIRRNDLLEAENYELKRDIDSLRQQINDLIDCDLAKEKKRIEIYRHELEKEINQLKQLKLLYKSIINKQSIFLQKNNKEFIQQTNNTIKEFNTSLFNR